MPIEEIDKGPFSTIVTFRLTKTEKQQLAAIVTREKSTRSRYIRDRIREIIKDESK